MQLPNIGKYGARQCCTASAMFTCVKVIIVNYGQGNHAIAEYLTTWCLIALPLPLPCLLVSR